MDLKQKRVRVWTKDINFQALTNIQARLNARTSFISCQLLGFSRRPMFHGDVVKVRKK